MNATRTPCPVLLGLLLIPSLVLGAPAAAAPECASRPGAENGVLRVAVREAPPFTQRKALDRAHWEGIAVELWEVIATRLELDHAYVELSLHDALAALESCAVDLVISPLTITSEREARFDFSHQYFRSGLAVAVPRSGEIDFRMAFATVRKTVASREFLVLVGIFVLVSMLFIALALRNAPKYERDGELRSRGGTARLVHFSLFGFLNTTGLAIDVFAFRSVGMQLISFLTVLFGITVSAGFFGVITASLTNSLMSAQVVELDRLGARRVATLADSTAERFLAEHRRRREAGFQVSAAPTLVAALDQVVAGKSDMVFGDWAQLAYLTRHEPYLGHVFLQDRIFRFEPYGWGLPAASGLRDPLNRELIRVLRSEDWNPLVRRYLGEGVISPH